MSRLYKEQFGEARRMLAFNALYRPRPAAVAVADNPALYRHAAGVIGPSEPVTCLEFGVADGGSPRRIAGEFSHPDCLFVGFDSFAGLPEDWMMHDRGAFATLRTPPAIDDGRVRFVPGWFQNTLHESLSWLAPFLSRGVLIHYDADLYSSTLFLLSSLWPYCRSYHFIMDDFMIDDIVALHDFTLSYPVRIDFIARREGGPPHSVLGRMTRVPFAGAAAEESAAELLHQAEHHARQGQIESALRLRRDARQTTSPPVEAWLAPARPASPSAPEIAQAAALARQGRLGVPPPAGRRRGEPPMGAERKITATRHDLATMSARILRALRGGRRVTKQ